MNHVIRANHMINLITRSTTDQWSLNVTLDQREIRIFNCNS